MYYDASCSGEQNDDGGDDDGHVDGLNAYSQQKSDDGDS